MGPSSVAQLQVHQDWAGAAECFQAPALQFSGEAEAPAGFPGGLAPRVIWRSTRERGSSYPAPSVEALAFAPDGRLASLSADGEVSIHCLNLPVRAVRALPADGPENAVATALAFATAEPVSGSLVTLSSTGSIAVYDACEELRNVVPPETLRISRPPCAKGRGDVAFAADGRMALAVAGTGEVLLLSLTANFELRVIANIAQMTIGVPVDRKAPDDGVVVLDRPSDRASDDSPDALEDFVRLAFAPSGQLGCSLRRQSSCSAKCVVSVFGPKGKCLRRLGMPTGGDYAFAFADDGRMATGWGTDVVLYTAAGGPYKTVPTEQVLSNVVGLAFDADGTLVTYGMGGLAFYNVAGICTRHLEMAHDVPVRALALFAGSGIFASGASDGSIAVYHNSGEDLLRVPRASPLLEKPAQWSETYWQGDDIKCTMMATTSGCGRRVLLNFNRVLTSIKQYGTSDGERKEREWVSKRAAVFGPDESLVLLDEDGQLSVDRGGQESRLYHLDLKGTRRRSLGAADIDFLAFLSDGRLLSCDPLGRVVICTVPSDLRGSDRVVTSEELGLRPQALALAPANDRRPDQLLVLAADGGLTVFAIPPAAAALGADAAPGLHRCMRRCARGTTALACPQGEHFVLYASGSSGGALEVFDEAGSIHAEKQQAHHGLPVTALAWTADGKLVSGSTDGNVMIWSFPWRRTSQPELVREALYPFGAGICCLSCAPATPCLSVGTADGRFVEFNMTQYPLALLWVEVVKRLDSPGKERQELLDQHPELMVQTVPGTELSLMHHFVSQDRTDTVNALVEFMISSELWGGLSEYHENLSELDGGSLIDCAIATNSTPMMTAVLRYLTKTPVWALTSPKWAISLRRLFRKYRNVPGFLEFLDSRLALPVCYVGEHGEGEKLPTHGTLRGRDLKVVAADAPGINSKGYLKTIATNGRTPISLRTLWLPGFQKAWMHVDTLEGLPKASTDVLTSTAMKAFIQEAWQSQGRVAHRNTGMWLILDLGIFLAFSVVLFADEDEKPEEGGAAAVAETVQTPVSAPATSRFWLACLLGQFVLPYLTSISAGRRPIKAHLRSGFRSLFACGPRSLVSFCTAFWTKRSVGEILVFGCRLVGTGCVVFAGVDPMWAVPVFGLRTLQGELRAMSRVGWAYAEDIWNLLDLAIILAYGIVPSAILYGLVDATSASPCMAIAVLLLWSRLLYFLRAYRRFSHLIQMMRATTIAVAPFLLLMLIILMGLSCGWSILAMANKDAHFLQEEDRDLCEESDEDGVVLECGSAPQPFAKVGWLWFASFNLMYRLTVLGDFPADAFAVADFSGYRDDKPSLATAWIAWLFFFIGTLFFLVLLLNLLIAIIGDKYDEVQMKSEVEFLRERATLCVEAFLQQGVPDQAAETDDANPFDDADFLIIAFAADRAAEKDHGGMEEGMEEEWMGRVKMIEATIDKLQHRQSDDLKEWLKEYLDEREAKRQAPSNGGTSADAFAAADLARLVQEAVQKVDFGRDSEAKIQGDQVADSLAFMKEPRQSGRNASSEEPHAEADARRLPRRASTGSVDSKWSSDRRAAGSEEHCAESRSAEPLPGQLPDEGAAAKVPHAGAPRSSLRAQLPPLPTRLSVDVSPPPPLPAGLRAAGSGDLGGESAASAAPQAGERIADRREEQWQLRQPAAERGPGPPAAFEQRQRTQENGSSVQYDAPARARSMPVDSLVAGGALPQVSPAAPCSASPLLEASPGQAPPASPMALAASQARRIAQWLEQEAASGPRPPRAAEGSQACGEVAPARPQLAAMTQWNALVKACAPPPGALPSTSLLGTQSPSLP